MNATTVREDAADRDVCPKCKAAAGEVCRTPSGRIAEMVHAGRPVKPREAEGRVRERAQFYASQGLRPVGTRELAPRDGLRSAKGAARRERKAALRRKRGFRV